MATPRTSCSASSFPTSGDPRPAWEDTFCGYTLDFLIRLFFPHFWGRQRPS